MNKLITNQNDIADATTEDLVHTYNELEGKSIKKFESREVAERRVANAILAATDRAGHRGVKVGETPKVANGKASTKTPKQTSGGSSEQTDALGKDADKKGSNVLQTDAVAKTPKEKAQKHTVKGAKQAQVEPGRKNKVSTKVQAKKAPTGSKVASVKVMYATDLATSQSGIRPDSFRGQILQTVIDNPGMAKAAIVERHQSYTADVLCKFKRMGLITESVSIDE